MEITKLVVIYCRSKGELNSLSPKGKVYLKNLKKPKDRKLQSGSTQVIDIRAHFPELYNLIQNKTLEEKEDLFLESTKKRIFDHKYPHKKVQKEKIILDQMEATIEEKSSKSLSQCLIDAYNLTKHKDLLQYIAKRDDVYQSRKFEDLTDGTVRKTTTFKLNPNKNVESSGLSKEEADSLKEKDIVDVLLYLYDITKDFDILKILSQRKDVFQTREFKDVDNKCIVTYKFKKHYL